MTRDEAIACLRALGHKASARDWSLGNTIAVMIGEPVTGGTIQVYPGAVYLYPSEDGTWNLLDCDAPGSAKCYDDLASAVEGAHEYVVRSEREREESSRRR